MTVSRRRLGVEGEERAAELLIGKGYRLIDRNWRCRSGEIDLIAERGERLIFVEVRSRRRTGRFGTPQESVTALKQKQVRETALTYLHWHRLQERPVRFDVIAVWFEPDGRFSELIHVEGAF